MRACAHETDSSATDRPWPCSSGRGSLPARVHPELSLPMDDDEEDEPAPPMEDDAPPPPPSSPPSSDSELSDASESESENGIVRAILRASEGSLQAAGREEPVTGTMCSGSLLPRVTETASAAAIPTASSATSLPPPPPPPPPPPSKQAASEQGAGLREAKRAHLRPLYWRTCSFDAAVSAQNTVWAKPMASYKLSPAERELIASEFCLKGHAEPTVVGSNSAERLSVMDAKRSNAVSFLLAKLPELPALAQAIYQMDSKVLDADRLTAMVRLWPTPLEIDAIERHNGDVRHCPVLSV